MSVAWPSEPLGDVCEIYQPKTISQKEMVDDGQYPVFGANGIIGRYDKFNHEAPQLLITCRGATCGSVNVSAPFSWVTGNAMVVRPKNGKLDLKFTEYFFRGAIDLNGVITGAAQPQITRQSLAPVTIPLPPLAEQRRIVAKLDQAFTALNRARAHAKANLADAEALFDGWLTAVFHDHPKSWKTDKLKNLCHRVTVGHVGPMSERYVANGTPFLRSQNVRAFFIDLQDVKYIDDDFVGELKKSELRPGDVAIVRTGYPGTAAVIPASLPVANCADLVIARTKDVISADFLVMFLNSSFGKQMVASKAVGAAQKHFNVGAAKEVDFFYPSIDKQDQIVAQSDIMRDYSASLALMAETKLTDLADLRQSLLQRAFSGQL